VLYSSIGCDSLIYNISITIKSNDSLIVSNDTIICEGQQVKLNVSGGGTGIYLWSPNNYLSCTSCSNPISSPINGIITYNVSTSDCEGNNIDRDVTIIVKANPIINVLSSDTCIFLGQLINLNSIDDGIKFNLTNWAINGINICIDCPNHTFQPYIQGTYIATVIDSLGCNASDSVDICLINECGDTTIVLPNFVTPNGDGANDVFRFENPQNLAITFMRIFDRWGEMLYESYDASPKWDATYQNNLVNSGVYVYYIEGICSNGGRFLKTGNISVIK
jgi:gliding motility-associated-like protein